MSCYPLRNGSPMTALGLTCWLGSTAPRRATICSRVCRPMRPCTSGLLPSLACSAWLDICNGDALYVTPHVLVSYGIDKTEKYNGSVKDD